MAFSQQPHLSDLKPFRFLSFNESSFAVRQIGALQRLALQSLILAYNMSLHLQVLTKSQSDFITLIPQFT